MKQPDYTYTFTTKMSPSQVFQSLVDIQQWWSGLFSEEITGRNSAVGDEFSFKAGEGMHYSKQKLTALIPDKKITWKIIDSNLSFLKDTSEWTGTNIGFVIEPMGDKTKVTFTHTGLTSQLECYSSCSSAWAKYMEQLQRKFSL